MTAFQLAGVAVAALLSENFILVNCLGIGTRTKAFQDPLDAWRTGVSLTAGDDPHGAAVLAAGPAAPALCAGLLSNPGFCPGGTGCGSRPAVLLKNCVPELSRRMDENLASITSNCAAMGAALLIAQRGYGLGAALLFGFFGRRRGNGGSDVSGRPAPGSQSHQLPQEFPGHPHRTCDHRPDGPLPGGDFTACTCLEIIAFPFAPPVKTAGQIFLQKYVKRA